MARLEEAAQHLEGVTRSVSRTEQLLADIREIRAAHSLTSGILPSSLRELLALRNPEAWGEMSPTKLGLELRNVYDGDGRQLEKANVPAHANMVGLQTWSKGAKFYPWKHFEAAWAAYGNPSTDEVA